MKSKKIGTSQVNGRVEKSCKTCKNCIYFLRTGALGIGMRCGITKNILKSYKACNSHKPNHESDASTHSY